MPNQNTPDPNPRNEPGRSPLMLIIMAVIILLGILSFFFLRGRGGGGGTNETNPTHQSLARPLCIPSKIPATARLETLLPPPPQRTADAS